jgi:hypothetical protein
MTALVATHPPTNSRAAADRRLSIGDEQHRDFARSAHTSELTTRTEVEVQAFAPGGDTSAIVALVMHIGAGTGNTAGGAEMMLSPDEARLIAHNLIIAADEADAITAQVRTHGTYDPDDDSTTTPENGYV